MSDRAAWRDHERTQQLLELALDTGGTTGGFVDTELRETWVHHGNDEQLPTGWSGEPESAIETDITTAVTREAIATGARVERTVATLGPAGQRQCRVAAEPLEAGDGTVEGAIFAVNDHSERYRLLDRTTDAVFTVDQNWTVTFWNEQMVERTGVEPADILGESLWDGYGEAIPPTLESRYRDAMATGDSQTFEQYVPDPHDHWLEIRMFADRHGLSVYSRDVTERRERERELQRTNERLEEFVGVVSHDLRSPLTVAGGALALARERNAPEDLDRIESAIDRMEALIDDLLTLAREGEAAMEREPISLATVAGSCWGNVETANATLQLMADRTLRADVSRLQQLLENLLRNAIEHGGTDVTVTIGDYEDGFYVTDDGPGIPESEREDVFESGYSTTPNGTGFGLSIVNAIAAAHDWTVELTESEDGGARFDVLVDEPP